MVGRAATCGLAFDKDAPTYDPAWATGPLHESRNGFYRLLPPYTRPIGVGDPRSEYAASSAVERHKRGEYTPPGLSAYLEGPHRTMQLDPRFFAKLMGAWIAMGFRASISKLAAP